ncbi:hypothetical protein Bca4012_088111 [Brassica carinata]
MAEVVVHIYDVTNTGSDKTNNTILQINRIFKDGIGLGGIFHSAIQVYGNDEWSYGYCEQGTGVFRCPSSKNPMYTYREKIVLGRTDCTIFMVNQIFRELTREWPGHTYDLLSRNCNHFCDVLCDRLGVPKLPASKVAYRFLSNVTSSVTNSTNGSPQQPGTVNNSDNGNLRIQGTWLKGMLNTSKPSTSTEIENKDEDANHDSEVLQFQQQP